MGNGTGLDIKHIGQTKILTPTTSFLLHDVLHVPLIKKNLLSVHKFTKDTNTYLEFHPSCFFVKDRATGKVLVQGLSNHGLYSFPSSLFRCCGPSSHPVSPAFVNERATLTQWYSRLRHAALRVVSNVVSKFGLLVFANKMDNSCPTCLSSKSHRLVFPLSTSRVTAPLELIYTDVWGLSPVCSSTGNKYYVSFMDSFSRYTWFYPMSCKSDVSSIFLKFQKYVERYFNQKIKTIQSDWGGEYRSLHQILQSNGISHRLSCPHTPQQIGVIKRKHHHLVETGLALMSHAGVPLKFWDDAFQTACYLINRLPTPLLQNSSPYETLFCSPPDYSILRIFGCECWPNLRPYTAHKLQPRSLPCIFVGYSLLHKGYKCLHSSTGRIYISRDVIFKKTHFPFLNSSPSSSISS